MDGIRTLLNREESYAIHALLNIAANPGTNAATIAEQLSMPKASMAKALRKLVDLGYVESQMGRNGGVWLKTPLEELSVLSVIESLSGTFLLDTCQAHAMSAAHHRQDDCQLSVAYHSIGSQMRSILGEMRLDALVEARERNQR